MWLWVPQTLGTSPWRSAAESPPAPPAERELLARAQEGDSSALAEIYEGYVERVYRFIALRVGSPAEAEDLTHEVFLKVIASIGSFRWRGSPLGAWIFRIARNLVVDHLRRRSRRPTLPLDGSLPSSDDPEAEAERNISLERVMAALEQLTESQRQAISLRFSAELSIEEVAQVMGKKPGAIKALQHSGLAALRRILSLEWRP